MLAAIADVLFPVSCPLCGRRGAPACAECLQAVRPPPLLPPPAGVGRWAAPFTYEGVVRELIARVKYRDERHAIAWLATCAAGCAQSAGLDRPDVVTWAPTTTAHRRARGFDHSGALARRVAHELGVPCRSLLLRTGGAAQTGRPARERRDGPQFEARIGALGDARAERRPAAQVERVLVVDDVATTGATLRAAACALRVASSWCEVDALTVARTPPPT
jgi:predicted amidophosphoribosyltransferase